jgi:hypothetical protein
VVIFSAIAAAIASVVTFIGTIGAIGTFALQMAAGIGISYLAKALAGKKPSSAPSGPSGVQGSLSTGGDVPRAFVVGDGATAGSLVYANTWGNDGQTPNAYFTQVIALSDLPIGGLNEVWVNGQKVTLGDTADADKGFPVTEYAKDGKDHLWIKFYDGTQTTADSFLTSKVTSTERPYESTRIGTGVAYTICTSLVEDTLFTGFPSFLFGVSGVKLYDPSKDDTAGGTGSHRYSDPSTWGGDGDKLPAVQIYNLLRGLTYQDKWFYGLQSLADARLPTANWIAQISKCRAEIDAGGTATEPTYRSGGQISLSTQLGDTIESLLTTCQGKLSEVGGFYKVFLGAPDSPVFTFTDDDILSTEEQSFTPFFGLSDTINGVTAKYPDPVQGWQTTAAPPLYRTDLEVEAGNRRLLTDVSLDFVPYSAQAQRLMKSALDAAQRARRHTLGFPPKFWYVEPGDVGEWTSDRNGYDAKLFEVNGAVDKANLDVTLDLTEVDPSDYDWNHDTDFQPVDGGTVALPRPAPQGIVDWFVEGVVLKDAAGNDRRPAIRMTWDGTMSAVTGVQYEVRLKSDASDVTRGRTDQLAAGALIISQSLLPNTQYQVRGQYLPNYPRDMLWSDWLDVTTPDTRLTALDFDADALAASVSNQFQIGDDKVSAIVQLVAATVAQALSKSALDKKTLRSELNAQNGRLSSSISSVQTVAASNTEAIASLDTTVTASIDDLTASVNENATAVADINGNLAASYGLIVDANGNIASIQALADGTGSALKFLADVIQFAIPGVTGGDAKTILQIGNVNGVPTLVLKADVLGDGIITAQHLVSGDVSALFGSFGTMEAGVIQSADGKYVIDLTNGREVISD